MEKDGTCLYNVLLPIITVACPLFSPEIGTPLFAIAMTDVERTSKGVNYITQKSEPPFMRETTGQKANLVPEKINAFLGNLSYFSPPPPRLSILLLLFA